MQVIELEPNTDDEHQQAFMDLNAEFLAFLGKEPEREMLERGLDNLLTSDAGAHGWLALDDDGVPVAMCYFNVGAGMACGGDYVWLNGIHVAEDARKRRHGSELLGRLEAWARERGYVLLVSSRHQWNEASGALFAKHGFDQRESVFIDKELR